MQIEGEKIEVVIDFFFLGSKITVDGDCNHEIRRWLLLCGKVVINLDSVLKSGDITLLTKVCIIKAMIFSVVTCGCESWTIKKAERQRTDAFELWCWRRLLRVPWTTRRSNQSILRVITLRAINLNIHWKNWCWSANILIIWCEQTIYWKSPWCWERLRAEGEEDVRGGYDWVASPMQWTWTWANSWGKWWGTGGSGVLQSLGTQGVTHN